jgi:spore germination cell wall hydrolase CwlJ-like protein
MNRLRDHRWPNNIRDVVRQHRQFSAWNEKDPNRPQMLAVTEDDPEYRLALEIARQARAGTLVDATGGANHYHARSMTVPPPWATNRAATVQIGGHRFFRL